MSSSALELPNPPEGHRWVVRPAIANDNLSRTGDTVVLVLEKKVTNVYKEDRWIISQAKAFSVEAVSEVLLEETAKDMLHTHTQKLYAETLYGTYYGDGKDE